MRARWTPVALCRASHTRVALQRDPSETAQRGLGQRLQVTRRNASVLRAWPRQTRPGSVAYAVGMESPSDAVPRVDRHRYAEAYARLDIALAKREARNPRDWSGWARDVASEPAGLPRLERLGAARGLASLRSFDSRPGDEIYAQPDSFVETVEQNLRNAADAGAIYVEVRFGGGTLLTHPDL